MDCQGFTTSSSHKTHQEVKQLSIKLQGKKGDYLLGGFVFELPNMIDASKLQVHNIVSSNKVISKVSFPRGLDKTSIKIIVNL